jgi:hypothetical protein
MNKHTTKCWARLSTNCCTPFWRSWLRTYVSTNSSIGLGSHPRDAACKEKIGWKLFNKERQINYWYISLKLILPSALHVRWMRRIGQCAWSPNHEFAGSGCRRRTVSAVRTALRSRAQYMSSIFPPRWMAVWIPAKPPPHSILQDRYPSRFFFIFFWCHTKNHATYFHSNKLEFKT